MDMFDIIGWAGMVLVLLAYALLSSGKIKNSYLYQTLNFVAALLMAVGLYPKNAWFSFTLQVIWGLIAIIAIARMSTKKKRKK